jgi:hypothetical protein
MRLFGGGEIVLRKQDLKTAEVGSILLLFLPVQRMQWYVLGFAPTIGFGSI